MKTLVDKLGMLRYNKVTIYNLPNDVAPLFAEVSFTQTTERQSDFLLAFVFSLREMQETIMTVNQHKALAAKGYFYLAYPKVQSQRYAGIKRDDIFPFLEVNEESGKIGVTDLKFSRMLKLNDDFTLIGLQWITTAPRSTTRASQKVADYEVRIPELQTRLGNLQVTLQHFNQLTPGYQREWARYVFSPKTNETQTRHFQQMISILDQGFSSVTQYRQSN